MAPSEVALLAAPTLNSTNSKLPQAVQIDLTDHVLEELLDCARNGKPPQILFGSNPSIRYGSNSYDLHVRPTKFRRELYAVNSKNKAAWTFNGLLDQSLAVLPAKSRTDSVDHALEVLKSRIAAEKEQREVNKTVSVLADKKKQPVPLNSRSNVLKPSSLSKSTNASLPAQHAAKNSSYLSPPKSAILDGTNAADANFLRKPIVHRLALGPQTWSEAFTAIVPRAHQNQFPHAKAVFKAVANSKDLEDPDAIWTLNDKLYKEVHPYEFGYNSEQREKVISNAIRAFDRLRLPKSDPLWDQLQPKERRGQGYSLSRLNLNPVVENTQSRTPVMTPKRTFDKKTGLPKKVVEPKKAKKNEETDKHSPEKLKAAAGVKDTTKSTATEGSGSMKDLTSTKPKAKGTPILRTAKAHDRPATTNNSRPATPNLPPKPPAQNFKSNGNNRQREVKPSTASKSLLNKPKNPSPLSRSPPVNASDFKDDHPVHKQLAAAISPARSLKRKVEDERDAAPVKRQKAAVLLSASDKASGSVGGLRRLADAARDNAKSAVEKKLVGTPLTGPLKRKAVAADPDSDVSRRSTPSKVRKIIAPHKSSTDVSGHSRADRTPPSTSSDLDDESLVNGEGGPSSRLTWRQALDAAVRFERYYATYKKLHHDLTARKSKCSAEEYEELMAMHGKIGIMKRQIQEASWKGQPRAQPTNGQLRT